MKKDIRIARQKLYLSNSCKVCLRDLAKKGIIWVRDKADDVRTCKDIYCSQRCLTKEFHESISKVQTNVVYGVKRAITQADVDAANASSNPGVIENVTDSAGLNPAADLDKETELIESIEKELGNNETDNSSDEEQ